MDLSQEFKDLVEDDKELERQSKKLSELSLKKVQLERNIRDVNLKLSMEQDQVISKRKENVLLENELLIAQKGVEAAQLGIEELIKKVITVEHQNMNLQVCT